MHFFHVQFKSHKPSAEPAFVDGQIGIQLLLWTDGLISINVSKLDSETPTLSNTSNRLRYIVG